MKSILSDSLELETPIEFTDDVLPGCLDTNPYTAYDDVLIVGYGLTSKPERNQNTGETYEGEPSRFLKQLDYKDISNQNEKCSRNKRIICANSNNEKERYIFKNKNHFVYFKTNFSSFSFFLNLKHLVDV